MKTTIPVNPAILKWARLSLRLSPGEVARRLHKSEENILAWEGGRAQIQLTIPRNIFILEQSSLKNNNHIQWSIYEV
jgi:hypothetical protein